MAANDAASTTHQPTCLALVSMLEDIFFAADQTKEC
jgi:hypothetical protein